jgi:hypothetical protein
LFVLTIPKVDDDAPQEVLRLFLADTDCFAGETALVLDRDDDCRRIRWTGVTREAEYILPRNFEVSRLEEVDLKDE